MVRDMPLLDTRRGKDLMDISERYCPASAVLRSGEWAHQHPAAADGEYRGGDLQKSQVVVSGLFTGMCTFLQHILKLEKFLIYIENRALFW